MKKIDLGYGVEVETPYMTEREAAAYLSVTPRSFRVKYKPWLRIHGNTNEPLYDSRQIDEYLKKHTKEAEQ